MRSLDEKDGRKVFRKTGKPGRIFRCEAHGLRELATSGEIRTAEVLEVGEDYLLTGYIESRTPQGNFFDRFGRQLARMHRHTSAMFGFREDNFIGENPQPNVPQGTEGGNWPEFFWNKRLLFQYRMAEKKGWVSTDLRAAFLLLETRIYRLLGESREPPSLLHGDLWSGNFLCDCENRPVLIDPAVYYGHRETELAMTRLFGGFPPAFYKAYEEEFPLPPGWPERHNLYALYHVLNHLNLFGRAYLLQAEQLAESYV